MAQDKNMTAGDILVETLIRWGVDTIFGFLAMELMV